MLPPEQLLPALLGTAVLLPLASFALILLIGPRLGPHGKYAGFVASGAIVGAAVLSLFALAAWLGSHFPTEAKHHDGVHPHGETSHVALDVGEEHSTLLTSFTSTGAAPHPVLGDASNHPLPENEGNETPEGEGEATHGGFSRSYVWSFSTTRR